MKVGARPVNLHLIRRDATRSEAALIPRETRVQHARNAHRSPRQYTRCATEAFRQMKIRARLLKAARCVFLDSASSIFELKALLLKFYTSLKG